MSSGMPRARNWTASAWNGSPASSGRRPMSFWMRCRRTITVKSSKPSCAASTARRTIRPDISGPTGRTGMAGRLAGKAALVIGAGSIGPGWGNGKATAVLFAREGASVICADINLAAAEETAGIIRSEGGRAERHCVPMRRRSADVERVVAALPRRLRPHRHPRQQCRHRRGRRRRRAARGRSGTASSPSTSRAASWR